MSISWRETSQWLCVILFYYNARCVLLFLWLLVDTFSKRQFTECEVSWLGSKAVRLRRLLTTFVHGQPSESYYLFRWRPRLGLFCIYFHQLISEQSEQLAERNCFFFFFFFPAVFSVHWLWLFLLLWLYFVQKKLASCLCPWWSDEKLTFWIEFCCWSFWIASVSVWNGIEKRHENWGQRSNVGLVVTKSALKFWYLGFKSQIWALSVPCGHWRS